MHRHTSNEAPSRSVVLGRLARRAAYRALQVWWYVARPETHGVKLVLRDGERLLFVRHAYGDRRVWDLPGGGRRRGEDARQTARREAREELGVDIEAWHPIGSVVDRDRATANLTYLQATLHDGAVVLQLGELEEARWSAPDAPPQPLGRHARAGLDLPGFSWR